jgi:hypothetical protein
MRVQNENFEKKVVEGTYLSYTKEGRGYKREEE